MKKNKYKIQIAEKYRLLFNALESNREDDIKCISFTSNRESEGKTIIAKNLAILAAKNGNRTLFIDCSLDYSSRRKSFRSGQINGIIDILQNAEKVKVADSDKIYIDDKRLKNYITVTKCENLYLMSLGTYNLDNYCKLFKIGSLKAIMEILKKNFDYIIVDAPTFKNLSYVQILTAATDGCLFVLKDGAYELKEGENIRTQINSLQCNVLGCVFNRVDDSNNVLDGKINNLLEGDFKNKKVKANFGEKANAEA